MEPQRGGAGLCWDVGHQRPLDKVERFRDIASRWRDEVVGEDRRDVAAVELSVDEMHGDSKLVLVELFLVVGIRKSP